MDPVSPPNYTPPAAPSVQEAQRRSARLQAQHKRPAPSSAENPAAKKTATMQALGRELTRRQAAAGATSAGSSGVVDLTFKNPLREAQTTGIPPEISVAHRCLPAGYKQDKPEFSIDTFVEALDKKTPALEYDVQPGPGGDNLVCHDVNGKRTTDVAEKLGEDRAETPFYRLSRDEVGQLNLKTDREASRNVEPGLVTDYKINSHGDLLKLICEKSDADYRPLIVTELKTDDLPDDVLKTMLQATVREYVQAIDSSEGRMSAEQITPIAFSRDALVQLNEEWQNNAEARAFNVKPLAIHLWEMKENGKCVNSPDDNYSKEVTLDEAIDQFKQDFQAGKLSGVGINTPHLPRSFFSAIKEIERTTESGQKETPILYAWNYDIEGQREDYPGSLGRDFRKGFDIVATNYLPSKDSK